MFGRALAVATLLAVTAAGSALAQNGVPPPPCFNEFSPLRQDADKKAAAVRAAFDERQTNPQEACQRIRASSEAEVKVVRFVETNAASCGIPDQMVQGLKTSHDHTERLRKEMCSAEWLRPRDRHFDRFLQQIVDLWQ